MTTETKVQHTPGPWHGEPIEDDAIEVFGQTSGIQERIATVYAADGGANAHLIAAAPALLESLEAMTSQLEESNKRLEGLDSLLLENMGKPKQGELGEIIRSRPVLRQARKAIALAKGEQDAN